ncbi:hypothetical protein CEXT_126311 [Caerostris extrusa]|uniref:Uncharacterized protein n=1 Tax=Caerostris extrusa TaxID=172846 RepID=A0AAV4XFP3_CAEEX|nr:hypothetical protein CEXT_126311 [Caerostris extrusa]
MRFLQSIRCTAPNCTCEGFTPSKPNIRSCNSCHHGWVAHDLPAPSGRFPLPTTPSRNAPGATPLWLVNKYVSGLIKKSIKGQSSGPTLARIRGPSFQKMATGKMPDATTLN